MLIQAIITAKSNGMTTTFGATMVPVRKDDIVIYNSKEYVVTGVRQELRVHAGAPVLHVEMKEKGD